MPRRRLPRLLALPLAMWCVFAALPAAAQTDAEVSEALDRMRAWLYDLQDPETGSFDDPRWSELKNQSYHATGETALITYALMLSGESHQDPRIAKAIEYLKANRTWSTYLASMRAHIWARMPDDYLPLLKEEAKYLESAVHEGRFHYQSDNPIWSNSLTQYGMLGIWEHAKRGGKVDDDLWQDIGEHIFADQNTDGGWGYNDRSGRGNGASTGSMTAAGIAILQIAQQQLTRDLDEQDQRLAEALQRGVDWLDQRYDPEVNPGLKTRYRFYYLYGIERLALANGISTLNGRDWFAAGAKFILEEEDGKGTVRRASSAEVSSRIDTAFALSFLARGRVPVWASKLQVPQHASNNRPNDLYFLTQFLSDQREAELNWQMVSIDDDPEQWLRAPLLYWSGGDSAELTPEQQANLKRYLDLGGTLMINIEGRGTRFRRSVEALVKEMYPRYKFESAGKDHPFQSLISQVHGTPSFRTLGNGARDLVVLPRGDWGKIFQAKEAGRGKEWQLMTNVYAALTDRGQLRNRLEPPLPVRDEKQSPSGTISVVRASYDGNWDAEPLALEVAQTTLFNRSGKELEITVAALDSLGADAMSDDESESAPALVHLTGTEKVEFTEEQLAAVKRHVESGGTLLVETVGGLGEFADHAADQFARVLDGKRRWLDDSHPIITGEGLDGGADNSRVTYRGYTQLQGSPGKGPSLAAVFVGDRPAVLISPRDLSLGVLGSRHYRINGYASESARPLMTNILLWSETSPTP
ncbi:DUF4159 domain-containing protein [Algisphaera agarilytica]|uniref:DUF4159 domain-containing protein n=1 Tax=Algisphaera agarilytica TaxID=1385975 RepID=A0A7X0H464_9BACT|nr:DUF4159 domain-containing protein [Algisphaera agarilytica]MBB6428737.1 hypothetical protein [Algisphaera agarilytica]